MMGMPLFRLAALILLLCLEAAALAQRPRPRVGNRCDVTFDPAVLSQQYNPMSPNDYVQTFVTVLRRPGGGANDEARGMTYSAVLLRSGDFRLPIELFVIDQVGSATGRVLYDRPGPVIGPELGNNGEIEARFELGEPLNPSSLAIRIPAGTEIDPGFVQFQFDVKYVCNEDDFRTTRGLDNRGLVVGLDVASAVQASLVGTEPDFGEIGGLSDTEVAAAGPGTTQRRQHMRVASTGPYEVNVVSQNQWRMTATGAPSGNPGERINYRYELLGQTLDSGHVNFTPVICKASGVSGENIALTATLIEGGEGKTPSPNYRDIITITITPLAASTGGGERCD